ncbi:MAG TPA: AAA family ATPase [Syntrophales bacterium]|nr:AAA family ATPase [Syntrophales bacterium]
MKLAISGKGGAGKSTLAAALVLLMARRSRKVLAVDTDPDANLAAALGIPASEQERIIPISRQAALIEERTGAKVKQYGQIFKLNPEVSDISDRFAYHHHGVALLVLGAIERGGGGCACPENVLMRALVTDLILYKDDALVMDMEAGVEHLGRATASGVDRMIVVIEPGQRAVDSTRRILRLAHDIGLRDIYLVANKVTGPEDEHFIREAFPESAFLGIIPYREELRRADRDGRSVLDDLPDDLLRCFEDILNTLEAPS